MNKNDGLDSFLESASLGFDAESPVVAGDDERIARIERAVQSRYGSSARRARPWRTLALGMVAGFLLASGAFAALGLVSRSKEPSSAGASAPPSASAAGLGHAPDANRTAPPRGEPAEVPEAPVLPDASRLAAPRAAVRATQPALPSTAPPSAPSESASKSFDDQAPLTTAGELFAAASRARVAGDATRAVALSQQLLREFPSSVEATSTHLSLGMLLLQREQAAPALREFEAYERSGTGQGLAEALWGKAQALRALGRPAEERATLIGLVQKYPRAAYATAAQKRLAALP